MLQDLTSSFVRLFVGGGGGMFVRGFVYLCFNMTKKQQQIFLNNFNKTVILLIYLYTLWRLDKGIYM